MKLSILSVSFLTLLPNCFGNKLQEKSEACSVVDEEYDSSIIDLNSSAKIIMTLIEKKELRKALVDTNEDGINLLIKNFSPAEMAFEVEVLNYNNPVFVLFYKTENAYLKQLLCLLEAKARELEDKAKFVKINAEELFKIASTSEVDIFPTVMIIHNREELERWEGQENITNIENKIKNKFDLIAKKKTEEFF